MADSIDEINEEIIAAKEANPHLAALNSTSKLSIWRLFCYVFAGAAWTLEQKQKAHLREVKELIAQQKVHKHSWYADMGLTFQYGHALLKDEDYYDNTGVDEAIVAAAKIVKHCKVVDSVKGLKIKTAKEVGGEFAPLDATEHAAFQVYMNRIKDAGRHLEFVSEAADHFKATIDVYYDPLVLAPDGSRLDDTNATPVEDAVADYLKRLPFNARYRNVDLTDALQKVEGVSIPKILQAQSKYALFPYSDIDVQVTPEAGYLKIYDPADLTINYKPYEVV